MILADVLSGLVEIDTDLLLAINGWRAEWADFFMYAFSGKWIWVPLYVALCPEEAGIKETLQQGSHQCVNQNAERGNPPYPDWNMDMLIMLLPLISAQPAEKPVTERSAYKTDKSAYQ